MAALRLELLGGLWVSLDETPVAGFISSKVPALLAYLAVTGRPHSRSALAGLLWSEVPETNARKSLSMALSNLRRLLAPHVVVDRQTAAFNRDSAYWLDVEAFGQWFQDVLGREGSAWDVEQMALLEKAVELYRGDFLEGMQLREAPLFEEWMLMERERLRQMALQALHVLANYSIGWGDYAAGIDFTSRLLAIEPWQEEAHRQLMLLLALSGRRSSALAQYETFRQVMSEELAVEPGAETAALYKAIKADRLSDTVAFLRSGQPVSPIPHHNLPPPMTPLIGREAELGKLTERLLAPTYRLVTLVGESGVGKTRLAMAAALGVVDRFAQGAWFVPLAGVPAEPRREGAGAEVDQVSRLALAVATALGFSFSGTTDPETQLHNLVRNKEMLLILDGYEHLLPEVGFVLALLRNARHLTVLVTSREPLNVQSEYAIRLEGLPVPATVTGPAAAEYASVRLFVERADRTPRGFWLDADNLPDVVEVCWLLEGLPLAIELAAPWVERLGCAEIAQSIQQSIDFLATTKKDVSERHRSMTAAFESSWRLLAGTEQVLLARLSVLRGFSAEAAAFVAGAAPEDLASLVRKSLLRRTASGRHEMHELLRQFAEVKLRALGMGKTSEFYQTQDRHSTFYLGLVERRGAALNSSDARNAAAEIRNEADNIRRAWRWVVTQFKSAEMERCADGLSMAFRHVGLFREGETAFTMAADRLRALVEIAERPEWNVQLAVGRLLAEQARFLDAQGEYDRAVVVAQESFKMIHQALDLAHELGESPRGAVELEVAARLQWGQAAFRRGDIEEGQSQLEEAVTVAQSAGLRSLAAEGLRALGIVSFARGDPDAASAYYEESLCICQQIGDRRGESGVLNTLGLTCGSDLTVAREYFEQSLRICREIGDRRGEAAALNNLGRVAALLGDYEWAGECLEQSLHISRWIGDRQAESEVLASLSLHFHHMGDDRSAREYGQQALYLSQELGHRSNQGYALTNLGHALLGLGHLQEAADAYRQAVDLRREPGLQHLTMEALAGLARASLARGRPEDLTLALAYVEEILAFLEDHGGEGPALSRTGEPFHVYLTCYQVFRAKRDPRAGEILKTAHALLQEQAASIADLNLRRTFLSEIAVHREIMREFEERP